MCTSSFITLPITQKVIAAQISNQNTQVCANSLKTYQLNQPNTATLFTDFDSITWSLSNPTLGSVSAGQNTNAMSVTWNNTATTQTVNLIATVTKCTLTQTFLLPVVVQGIPQLVINPPASTICSGETALFQVSSPNVVLNPNSVVTWQFGNQTITGGLSQSHTFTNIGNSNTTVYITALIASPNGCSNPSTVASFTITVLPTPAVTISNSSQQITFCTDSEINNSFIAATGSGATLQWFFNNNPIPANYNGTNTTLLVNATNNLGFGSYYFVATYPNGCSIKSSTKYIYQNCGQNNNPNNPNTCTLSQMPVLANTSSTAVE